VTVREVGLSPLAVRPPRPGHRLALVVLVAGGAGGVVLSWAVAQHSLVGGRWTFELLVAVWVPLWLLAAGAAQRLPTRWALVAVLILAALLRLAAASGTTASVSNDAERYAWDAHVQLSGTDPYRYPPDAAQVADLRTRGFWPTPAECHHIDKHRGCTVLNRPGVRTIYPPVAEAWFVAVDVVAGVAEGRGPTGNGAGYRPWQLAGGLVDEVTVGLLAVALRQQRRDPRLVAWYALSPVAVIEFAGNGHVDGVALALLIGALIALRRDRQFLAGVLIGAATMVKLYPGVALVAGWRRGGWRMLVAAAAVVAGSELPHVVAVGARILGYLPGYINQEHYNSGGRFLLLSLTDLPGHLVVVLAAACMLAAVAAVWRWPRGPEVDLAVLLAVLIAVTTPVQPWYAVAMAGVAVAAGAPALLAVPLAAEPYYAAVVLHAPHQTAIGRLAYGAAWLVAAILAAQQHARRRVTLPAP
jgi:hypothetical protein